MALAIALLATLSSLCLAALAAGVLGLGAAEFILLWSALGNLAIVLTALVVAGNNPVRPPVDEFPFAAHREG